MPAGYGKIVQAAAFGIVGACVAVLVGGNNVVIGSAGLIGLFTGVLTLKAPRRRVRITSCLLPRLETLGLAAVIGRRVRSFLLQFNPVDPSGQESNSRELGSKMRRIEGSITFSRPVTGLIVNSETLRITDKVFALRRGPIRPFKRGLELSPPRTADVVSLSEDRHTLTLKLAVFNQFSGHVRVIVDASLSDVHDQNANSN